MEAALLDLLGAAVGGALGSVAAIRVLMRRIAREESEATVVRRVRPEALHRTGDFPAVSD